MVTYLDLHLFDKIDIIDCSISASFYHFKLSKLLKVKYGLKVFNQLNIHSCIRVCLFISLISVYVSVCFISLISEVFKNLSCHVLFETWSDTLVRRCVRPQLGLFAYDKLICVSLVKLSVVGTVSTLWNGATKPDIGSVVSLALLSDCLSNWVNDALFDHVWLNVRAREVQDSTSQ